MYVQGCRPQKTTSKCIKRCLRPEFLLGLSSGLPEVLEGIPEGILNHHEPSLVCPAQVTKGYSYFPNKLNRMRDHQWVPDPDCMYCCILQTGSGGVQIK